MCEKKNINRTEPFSIVEIESNSTVIDNIAEVFKQGIKARESFVWLWSE